MTSSPDHPPDNNPDVTQDHSGKGDNVGNDKVTNNQRTITIGTGNYIERIEGNYIENHNVTSSSGNNDEALELWREKLKDYLREEAIASDPEKKFQLKQLIKDCQSKIQSLGG